MATQPSPGEVLDAKAQPGAAELGEPVGQSDQPQPLSQWRSLSIRPSTNIAAAAYNEQTQDLRIEFWRGHRTYIYHQVDAQTVEAWERAESSGKYFDTFIRGAFGYDEQT